MGNHLPRFLVAGQLTRNYILLPSGEALLDKPGGNAIYAAVGLAVWEPDPPPGVVARVGDDYPREWLDHFSAKGLDVRGVHTLPEAVDVRWFSAYTSWTTRSNDDPVQHMARLGLEFPRELLGYHLDTGLDNRTRRTATSLRQADIPPDFLDATAAHLCPLDYLTHSVLPAILRQAQFSTITLDPSSGYMNSIFWDDVPALLTGLAAFMPAEEELRALFQGRTTDLWEMAASLAAYGCEIIVIKRGERGQYLYDSASRTRWEVPAYPARLANLTGAGDAFCGGFLAGYRRTFDPLEATLHGNISASLTIEGLDPLYAMDALPGLAQARLEALRQSARKI